MHAGALALHMICMVHQGSQSGGQLQCDVAVGNQEAMDCHMVCYTADSVDEHVQLRYVAVHFDQSDDLVCIWDDKRNPRKPEVMLVRTCAFAVLWCC